MLTADTNSGPMPRATRTSLRCISAVALAAALLGAAAGVAAQEGAAQKPHWEFIVASGALVPTGSQGDVLKRADLTLAQLTYVIRPEFAVTTALGWARSHDVASAGRPKLDVFTGDVGAEVRPARWIADHEEKFNPFAGIGVGMRSYHYRNLDAAGSNNLAGYISAGGEFGMHRVRVRLEVRDYLSGFKPLNGTGTQGTRNDVVAMLGLRLVKKTD